jgi:hypothetical protein
VIIVDCDDTNSDTYWAQQLLAMLKALKEFEDNGKNSNKTVAYQTAA